MNILIIGGTGILSSAVVDECVGLGYNVTMINRGRRKLFINPKVRLIKCDIHDEGLVKHLLGNSHYDCVIDFLIYNINQLKYSLNLLGNISDQYVFISSTAVYNTDTPGILKEDSEKVQKEWNYSKNKYDCEQYLIHHCNERNINYTIIRPGVNYGNTRIPYGMYPAIGKHWTIIGRILSGKPIITWNGGANKHNLTRVEDFARGAVSLLGNPKAAKEAFNVVGDGIYTWMEVLSTISDILKVPLHTIDIPVQFYANELSDLEQRDHLIGGRSKNCMTSNEKLKTISPDYHQLFSLKEGVERTINFYKEHDYLGGIDYEYEGNIDRIIDKYQTTAKIKKIQLGFKDYLGATGKVKLLHMMQYYGGRYKDSILTKVTKRIIRLLKI